MKIELLGEEFEFTAWDVAKCLGAAIGFLASIAAVFLIFG